jgi:hypothetical protein
MKASEILRKLADVIDSQDSNPEQDSAEITNRPGETAVDVPTDTAGIEAQAGVEVATMVPPLQQKLELMKKMAGVDDCAEPESDELDIIKQNAGIRPLVVALADEDEPFEG